MSTALLSGEPEIPDIYDELMVGSIVPEDELIAYYSQGLPVDVELLEPLGLIAWAAIRLQHTVRDTLGMYLGEGLSGEPFELTLGSAIRDLDRAARSHGEPWASQIESWTQDVARRALNERNRITAVAYTAADREQAL